MLPGYLTACMGRWVHPKNSQEQPMLGKTGTVYAMDIHKKLVDNTRNNIMKADADLLESNTVQLQVGDGWKGWPEAAPFDAIHVGAAADGFPAALAGQLKLGGTLVVPIGPEYGVQYFYNVKRVKETCNPKEDYKMTKLMGVRYVPLVHG